jgi:ABC-type phosphate transport system ATPase subunit
MKQKESTILEHLRKAKARGSILFKKIEVFKKQRDVLELRTNLK